MHWADRMMQRFYPSKHASPYIQPPVLAEAVEHIYEQDSNIEFMTEILPQLKKYYLYLDKERSRSNDGLLEIITSYESGKDRSPEYDLVYGESNAKPLWRGPMPKLMIRHWIRGWNLDKIFAANLFRVKDVLFNCIYAQNLCALSRLCQAAGEEEAEQSFREKTFQIEDSILRKMYCQETGLFYSLDARHDSDEQLKVSTISSLMPLILDSITEAHVERLVEEHLYVPSEFWTDYPLPAVPLSSAEEIEGHIIWRGLQTWIYPNWYIARGLRKQALRFPRNFQKYNRIADELTQQTYELVRKEGFCDFYHSQTGKRGVGPKFSWSTLALDMVYDLKQGGDE
jgi:neutral trehalase